MMHYEPFCPQYFCCPYYYNYFRAFYNHYLALEYFRQLREEDSGVSDAEEVRDYRKKSVNSILRIFLTRRRDVLALIEVFGVPRYVSIVLTRRIIRFVLENAKKVKGNLNQKVRKLFNKFIKKNRRVIIVLKLFGVPQPIINRYIRRVIRVTLRNIDRKK
ncbi:MAG: hypothetical protein KAX49_19365 [Halanaerobiales bacterium]|nr:hypothetical protein [Halanaerobiales bacterium]